MGGEIDYAALETLLDVYGDDDTDIEMTLHELICLRDWMKEHAQKEHGQGTRHS
ncbi:MAG: hypothetical protein ACRCZI_01390 [Cetobacterium sp.]